MKYLQLAVQVQNVTLVLLTASSSFSRLLELLALKFLIAALQPGQLQEVFTY